MELLDGNIPPDGWAGRTCDEAVAHSVRDQPQASARKLALQLAVLAFFWVAAMGTGTLGTDDSDNRLAMAHGWVTHSSEVSNDLPPPVSRQDVQHGVVGRDGKRVVFYDPGQSLLMLPFDWIGTKVADTGILKVPPKSVRVWVVNWLLFQPLNVALVLVCFWTMLLLGFEPRLAALSTFLWLVATTVLPYAQITWQNHQVLLFSLLSLVLILRSRRSGHRGLLVASGAAAAMAVLVRSSAAIHLLTAGLLLLFILRQESVRRREAMKRVAAWLCGAAPLILADRIFDYLRYGSLLATGQSVWLANLNRDPLYEGLPLMPPGYPFTIPASEGILGVLFSPAKSLFIYDPLLLPCLIVGAVAWKYLNRYVRWFTVVALINLVLHIILTSKLYFWHGDMSWAARYHISSVHLILVALLPVLLRRILDARKVWAFAGAALVIGSLTVQLLAVAMPSVEIVVENLKEPVICEEDDWNYKLEFRIAGRATALYCLETGSLSASCPEQIARAAETAHPDECRDMVAKFRRANRLAFFPFYKDNQIFGHRKMLALWLPLAVGAILGGVFWSARRVREIRRAGAALSPA